MFGDFVAGIGSGLVNAFGNYASARQMNKFTSHMSDTAMQRRVKDLDKAGLNVGLAYSSGGASSPSSASMDFGNSVAAGINAATARAQLRNIREQNRNIAADTNIKEMTARRIKYGKVSDVIGTGAVETLLDGAQQAASSAFGLFKRQGKRRWYDMW